MKNLFEQQEASDWRPLFLVSILHFIFFGENAGCEKAEKQEFAGNRWVPTRHRVIRPNPADHGHKQEWGGLRWCERR
jgi:hypothetical protein